MEWVRVRDGPWHKRLDGWCWVNPETKKMFWVVFPDPSPDPSYVLLSVYGMDSSVGKSSDIRPEVIQELENKNEPDKVCQAILDSHRWLRLVFQFLIVKKGVMSEEEIGQAMRENNVSNVIECSNLQASVMEMVARLTS